MWKETMLSEKKKTKVTKQNSKMANALFQMQEGKRNFKI